MISNKLISPSSIDSTSSLIGFKRHFGWWIFNTFLRIVFGLYNLFIGSMLDNPAPKIVTNFIIFMFLFLGISGIICTVGWGLKRSGGYKYTLFVCLITIFFDIWGMTVQLTAMVGFIVPTFTMIHFYRNRRIYFNI